VTVDHDAEEPLYLQLAAILRGQIQAGTAERALAVLRDEGLVRSRIGRGHFVVPEGERSEK